MNHRPHTGLGTGLLLLRKQTARRSLHQEDDAARAIICSRVDMLKCPQARETGPPQSPLRTTVSTAKRPEPAMDPKFSGLVMRAAMTDAVLFGHDRPASTAERPTERPQGTALRTSRTLLSSTNLTVDLKRKNPHAVADAESMDAKEAKDAFARATKRLLRGTPRPALVAGLAPAPASAPPLRAVTGVQAVSALPEIAAWARRYPFYADGWYTSILASDGFGLPSGIVLDEERMNVTMTAQPTRSFPPRLSRPSQSCR